MGNALIYFQFLTDGGFNPKSFISAIGHYFFDDSGAFYDTCKHDCNLVSKYDLESDLVFWGIILPLLPIIHLKEV